MEGFLAAFWIFLGTSIGVFLAYLFFVYKRKTIVNNDVKIVMNHLKSVSKLVTVEGEFSEIYQHKEASPILFNWFTSEKKALVIIKAKVMMGYNLTDLKYEINSNDKTISIIEKPKASILSMHLDAEYYDIKHGTFNRFSKDELIKIEEDSKQLMIEKIESSDLPKMVEEQSNKGFELLENTTKALGWKLN